MEVVRSQLDFSQLYVKARIENRAYEMFFKRLGRKNQENAQAYEQSKQLGIEVWRKYKGQLMPEGSYAFSIGDELQLAETQDFAQIQAEFMVILSCIEVKIESVLEQYLFHVWQVCYLDSVREYLQTSYFKTMISYFCKEEAKYISPWLGPGLWEMPMEKKEEYLSYIASKNGEIENLSERKSFIGGLLSTYQQITYPSPCKLCKAQRGCEYCMITIEKEIKKEDSK